MIASDAGRRVHCGPARPQVKHRPGADVPSWVILIGLCGMAGCSLYLDWESAGLLCDPDALQYDTPACKEGYSCLGDECIKDGSVVNHSCNQDVQCKGYPDYVCPTSLASCRRACTQMYQRGVCEAGSYCRPALNGDTDYLGVCEPSSRCESDEDCGSGGLICIELSGGASDCFTPCSIHWDDGGSASHTCASTPSRPLTCQPLGTAAIRLACVPAPSQAPQEDEYSCTPVTSPCGSVSACLNGMCRAYCDLEGSGCAADRQCCPFLEDDTDQTGVCLLGPC